MKKIILLLSSLLISHYSHCSDPKKPTAPQAQRDAKGKAEAGTQTSSATERWQIAKWKVLADFRRTKLEYFTKPLGLGLLDPDHERVEIAQRIGQLELALAQRTKERDQLSHAFERAKELKATVTTHEHTIKLLQGQNRKLAADNKTLTNKLAAKSKDELP